MQSSAKPSREWKRSIIRDQNKHVMGSVENCGAMPALSEVRFQRGTHLRRNVVVQVIRNFTAHILAV
jgi:hypothetical protein